MWKGSKLMSNVQRFKVTHSAWGLNLSASVHFHPFVGISISYHRGENSMNVEILNQNNSTVSTNSSSSCFDSDSSALLAKCASRAQANCALKSAPDRLVCTTLAPNRTKHTLVSKLGHKTQHLCPTCALRFLRWNHTRRFCWAFYHQLLLDTDLPIFVLPITIPLPLS